MNPCFLIIRICFKYFPPAIFTNHLRTSTTHLNHPSKPRGVNGHARFIPFFPFASKTHPTGEIQVRNAEVKRTLHGTPGKKCPTNFGFLIPKNPEESDGGFDRFGVFGVEILGNFHGFITVGSDPPHRFWRLWTPKLFRKKKGRTDAYSKSHREVRIRPAAQIKPFFEIGNHTVVQKVHG